MTKNDQKTILLMTIKMHPTPISLSELMDKFEHKINERTLRRWLYLLIQAGEIQKMGVKKGVRYQVRIPLESSTLMRPTSLESVAKVKLPLYQRDPKGYQQNFLNYYEPNATFYLSAQSRELLMHNGKREYNHAIAGTYARHIYNRLLIDLSFNSSRLEGNTYSLLETEKLIFEGSSNDHKLDSEKVMILNHKDTIRYLVDNIEEIKIAPHTIFTVHYLLSDGLLPPTACGTVRDHGVKIGGSTYLPLDNKDKLENILNVICEKAAMITNPFEQSFFLLIHLSYLQAFEDCNKRTSRLSANIPLIRENLVPMSFNDIPKEEYMNAMLAIYEFNETGPLEDLYVYSYLRTCKQYDINVELLGFDRIRVQYRSLRREMIREIIIQKMDRVSMKQYIAQNTENNISQEDKEQFINVILSDLNLLSINNIAGIGISMKEFQEWKALQKLS